MTNPITDSSASNPFLIPKGPNAADSSAMNPFLVSKTEGIRITRGLPPAPRVPVPDADYLQTKEGQELILKGIAMPENLGPGEKRQFDAALEAFPEIQEIADRAQAAREMQDTEPQQKRAETLKDIVDKLGLMTAESVASGEGNAKYAWKMFDTFMAGAGEVLSPTGLVPPRIALKDGQSVEQTMSEAFADVFTKGGLDPVEPGDEFQVFDGEKWITRKHTTVTAISNNLLRGAVRLAPELLAQLMDNPYLFAKGLLMFPYEETKLILQAADTRFQGGLTGGLPVPGVFAPGAEPLFSDQEVAAARKEIMRNPIGVAMLGLLAVGAGRGLSRKGGRVLVPEKTLLEQQKVQADALAKVETLTKAEKVRADVEAKAEAARIEAEKTAKPEEIIKPEERGVPDAEQKPDAKTEDGGTVPARKDQQEAVGEVQKGEAGGKEVAADIDIRAEKIENVKIDPERFQNRETEFSEASVERITASYDPTKFDPITVWKDPKSGEPILLSGHSRYEAARRLGLKSIPIREFKGTEAEAIHFAKVEANRLATAEGLPSDVAAFKIARDAGKTKKELDNIFGREVANLEAYTYLEPGGKLMEVVTDRAFQDHPHGQKWARAIGELRRDFPELTNRHESQIFDALYKDPGISGWNKGQFRELVEKQVTDMEWTPNQPLVFKKGQIPVTGARARADIGPTLKKIDELKQRWNQAKTVEERNALKSEVEKLKADVDKFADTQADIFGVTEVVKPEKQLAGGFGAVNPFESLEARLARLMEAAKQKREQLPEGEIANEPSILIARTPKDVGLSTAVRTPSNVFGVSPGQPARYGATAQKAARDIILTERDIMVEAGKRGEILEEILRKVDKKDWGKKGDKFYDHVVDPTRDGELSPSSRTAAVELRKYMEEARQTIIKARREDILPSVAKITERAWRQANDLTGKRLSAEQRATMEVAIDEAVKARVPDDWGIENYLPQMHPGQWRVTVVEGGGELSVGSARTPAEALDVAMRHYAEHPELSPEAYSIKGRAFTGGDVLRVSRGRMFKVVKEIADAADGLLTQDQVTAALRGTVGTTAGRSKFAGFLQKRTGAEGYSKDITKVLAAHNQAFVRWTHLRSIRKRVQPLIDKIRGENRPNTAAAIEGMLDHLWGRTPSVASKLLDATLQSKYSPVRNWVAPQALERWAGHIKGATVNLFLKMNPRFHFLNRLQRYQTTAPLLEGVPHLGEWQRGTQFYRSPEGKAVLKRFGIGHLTGGKILEGGRTLTKPQFRESARGFAPETSNQEIAYATMYKRAKDMGYSDVAANDYAFLKGNLQTQFIYLATDMPPALRGPIASTLFQFKRFQIKNLEIGYDLLASRNTPGVTKWLGAQLLFGGTRLVTKAASVAGLAYVSAKTYQAIKDEHGETVADGVAFGLPGLIGLDMSYSLQLIDTPFGDNVPEAIGNLMLSPMGSVAVSVGRAALDTDATETSALKRAGVAATQRVPALKWIEALQALGREVDEGVYEFRDPAGRLKFRGDLKDIIVKGLGGRTTKEGEISILTEALAEVMGERDNALDHIAATAVKWLNGDGELDLKPMYDWNELYPEFPITNEAIKTRLKARYKGQDLDRWERALQRAPLQIRYSPLGRNNHD